MKTEFEKMLDKAAKKAIEMEIREEADVEFSKEHDEKMQNLFRKEKHQKNNRIIRYVSAVAAVVVAIFALYVFKGGVITRQESNTEQPDAVSGKDNRNDVKIDYVPKGFVENGRRISANIVFLSYKKGDEYFRINVNSADDLTEEIKNAEDGIVINGFSGLYSEKDGVRSILWSDGERTFSVTGNIEKDEIVKIANGVTPTKGE